MVENPLPVTKSGPPAPSTACATVPSESVRLFMLFGFATAHTVTDAPCPRREYYSMSREYVEYVPAKTKRPEKTSPANASREYVSEIILYYRRRLTKVESHNAQSTVA